MSKLEAQLREARQHADKLTKELNLLSEKETKLHDEIKEKVSENTKLMQTNSVKQMELKRHEDEIAAVGDGPWSDPLCAAVCCCVLLCAAVCCCVLARCCQQPHSTGTGCTQVTQLLPQRRWPGHGAGLAWLLCMTEPAGKQQCEAYTCPLRLLCC